ncbi:hypothetical protein D3C75_1134580 [compost metagenome]
MFSRLAIRFKSFYQHVEHPATGQLQRRRKSALAITNDLVVIGELIPTKPLQKILLYAPSRQRTAEYPCW